MASDFSSVKDKSQRSEVEVVQIPSDTESIADSARPESAADGSTKTGLSSSVTTLADNQDIPDEAPYHVLNRERKLVLVYIVSLAGMFSPLSSNIYFPAIDTISADLHTNTSLVALTITVYMIVQGIAPSFWGPWSDIYGRRLLFMCTLGIYVAANLALAFTANYVMLLVLRGVQAAGSAATISIGTGVIADIAAPGERGGFIGTNSGLRMIGQALGPVLGGIFNGIWGFRSIFWFLFVLAVLVLGALLMFLPETQRAIAGNGSIPLTGVHRPLIYFVIPPPKEWVEDPSRPARMTPRLSFGSILKPLKQLVEKDILALLAWGALVYAVWSMVTSSTTTVLVREFPKLTQVELGLCFLPNGFGCVLGSILTGKLMDRNFRKVEKHHRQVHQISDDVNLKGDRHFPYERARLSPTPYLSAVFILTTALYGASYELNNESREALANLLISLTLQFFIAFSATGIFSINSAVMVDCFPDGSAGATALNNLARCSLGAVGVSVVQPMISALRVRNTFLVLAAVVALCSPLVWIEWKWGEKWRSQREDKKEQNEEK